MSKIFWEGKLKFQYPEKRLFIHNLVNFNTDIRTWIVFDRDGELICYINKSPQSLVILLKLLNGTREEAAVGSVIKLYVLWYSVSIFPAQH